MSQPGAVLCGRKDLTYTCTEFKKLSKELPSPALLPPQRVPKDWKEEELDEGRELAFECQRGAGDFIVFDYLV